MNLTARTVFGRVTVALALTVTVAAATMAPGAAGEPDPALQVFDYTGHPVAYQVPDNVTAIDVVLDGAMGGGDWPGIGARVSTQLAVTPGQWLQVTVGGTPGSAQGGFNGGGAGGAPGSGPIAGNYGGGGASDIRTGDCAEAMWCPLANRIAVAGGGGAGSGLETAIRGGHGGNPDAGDGGDGFRTHGGTGATGTDPGTGGNPSPSSVNGNPGQTGTLGQGGQGGANNIDDPGAAWCAGSGGGGGYLGGGGGGSDAGTCETGAGGGGGSSMVDPAIGTAIGYEQSPTRGNGRITITPADPAAPALTIEAATDVNGPDATLHAIVNPKGDSAEIWFETAVDDRYTQLPRTWTAIPNPVGGNTDTPVTALATGLNHPSARYRVRVHARTATRHTVSDTITFTTPGTPDKPAAPAAWASGNPTGINVSWTEPGDGGTPITGYQVTTSPTGGGCTTSTATDTECSIDGLDTDTAYRFQVRAVNHVGPSAWSNQSTRTTPTPQPLLVTNQSGEQILVRRPQTVTFALQTTIPGGDTITPNLPGSIELTHGNRVLCRATVDQGQATCTLRVNQPGTIRASAHYTGSGAANQARATTTITLHAARATITASDHPGCPRRITITGQTTQPGARVDIQQLTQRHGRDPWRTITRTRSRHHQYRTRTRTTRKPTITLRARTGHTNTTPVTITTSCPS